MTLRRKLLAGQAPLAVALLVVGLAFVATVRDLGRLGSSILENNYRSVLAAQRMKDAVERIDSGAMFLVVGRRDKGLRQIDANVTSFETELGVEEQNITEPGETHAATALRAAWTSYRHALDAFMTLEGGDVTVVYFSHMEAAFLDVKHKADDILDINQDAMVRRSDRAARSASNMTRLVTVLCVVALLAGVLGSSWLTGRLLLPLDSLTSAVRQIGSGDLAARATPIGKDELAELAREFNAMAEHLQKYRQSSLGALLSAQQASQAAIDAIPDPVLILDLDSNVTESNQAAAALFEQGGQARDQSPLAGAAPELRAAIERVRDHVLGGHGPYLPKGFEEAVRLGERYLLPRATPLYGEAHEVQGVTIVLLDVTRLHRFDELRNDLVATVAHELRTPLTSLQMAIHLCIERAAGPITERQADLLYAARDDCQRLQTIVEDLLDLARLQRGAVELKKVRVAPAVLVEESREGVEPRAKEKAIRIETEVEPSLPEVLVDPDRIKIALSNLLGNAVRHTPDAGTVSLRVSSRDGSVRFEVVDSGAGIAREHRDRVFERFYRVPGQPSGGAGLGLSIAKEIVEAHGGTIGLEAPEAGGSVFWFQIP
jgi:two-component system, NtrC family, sensor histidine kinase KinB